MELYGEFTPFRKSWEIDRIGVHRIVMARQYRGEPPMTQVPTPPREILHVLTKDVPETPASGVVEYYFEGATEEDIGTALEIFEFNGSFNQEPIFAHPKFPDLLREYRGRMKDGRVEWPPRLLAGGSGGLGGTAAGESDINPLFGVESFLDFGAVWSRTRMFSALPDDLWAGVGEIYENPPGNPPDPGRRNWLRLPPVGRQRGNVTEVSYPFLLSGRNAWVAPIYDGSIV